MLEASVFGRLRSSPKEFLLVPSSVGDLDDCLLKDAKAEAGLQPV